MKKLSLLASAILATAALSGQNKYTVDFKDTGVKIQPTMYGIFFEDINFGADGGLYAELIKNRSFEFDPPMLGWEQPGSDRHSLNEKSGYATVLRDDVKSNHNFVRIEVNNDAGYSLVNEGFKGIGVKAGAGYDFSVALAKKEGNISEVKFQLIDGNGAVLGECAVLPNSGDWKTYTAVIKPNKTEAKAKLKVTFKGSGTVLMDMVSLFPQDTWKGRKGGLRKDLVEKLADLKPGFLRFPGGCIVEGRILAERYQWKKTVGKVEDRELLINRWNTEFKHRPAPDYFQTFGLGFFEYFQLSEDLGAQPLPILSCGMACQFNTGELVHMHDLDPYVQDALDLIEFANGDASTKWGKLRSEMGHPKPFNLKYIGVGNEQWGPDYIERYKVFEKAIHGKYPDIIIISGSGPYPNGEYFEYGWDQLKSMNAQIVDEHYYNTPQWFKENATRYDKYDRKGPKVFAGEYAAQSVAIASPDNKNNWDCALAEAAFMTGLERNAEVVTMCSYAPLLAHADGWQWTPDLIWFNNLEAYATPNYYVQQAYSNNPGTDLISITDGKNPVTGKNNMFASAVIDKKSNEVILKIVNTGTSAQNAEIALKGKVLSGSGTQTTIGSNSLQTENGFTSENIKPVVTQIKPAGKKLSVNVPAQSLIVVRAKLK